MNDKQVDSALEELELWLHTNFPTIVPEKIDGTRYLVLNYDCDKISVSHLKFMIPEMREMFLDDSEEREKLMRWLGFVQGALWARGYISIDDCRELNTKEVEK